jgi:hypothetical protein
MTERRFTDKPDLAPWAVRGLDPSHPAMVENRTLFPSTVVDVTEEMKERLLVSGENNTKLGKTVAKGRFKGYALYGLSLEERATCPADCAVRAICYGGSMPFARRHRIVEPDVFFDKLGFEIADLAGEHEGLLIRLHVLGDFPDVEYVGFWADVLSEYPNVACYGYTSRSTTAWGGDEIGDAIQAVKDQYPDRFRIRWSSPVPRPDGAMVINNIPQTPRTEEGIVCPAQTDATACCASCALCWEAPKDTILFVKHGPKSGEAAAASAMAEAVEGLAIADPQTIENGSQAAAPELRTVQPMKLVPPMKPLDRIAPTPEPRMVFPEQLRMEAAYQRDLSSRSVSLIRKIVNGWDWAKFKPPICAEGPTGLYVIDGQHTAIAAATRGIRQIPVLVVSAKEVESRAAAFVSHNRDRLAMSPFQILHAEAAAGDATARAVLELGEKTGAVIPRSAPAVGKARPGTILSIADLRQAVAAGDAAIVERVLRIAVMIEAKPLPRMVFRALRMMLSASHFAEAAKCSDAAIANAMEDVEILNEMARERAAQTGEPNVRACASIIAIACTETELAA